MDLFAWLRIGFLLALVAGLYTCGRVHGSDARDELQAEVKSLTDQLRGEVTCADGTRCAQRLADSALDGERATTDAVLAAVERARAEQDALAAQAQAALDRAAAATSRSQREAAAWRAKYDRAVSTDARCRAWAEQPIYCPTS